MSVRNKIFSSKTRLLLLGCGFFYSVLMFPLAGFSQYCIPTYSNLCSSDDYINNFTLNTLSVLNSNCNGNPNNYILDLVNTTSLNAGGLYPMTMQSGPVFDQGFGVWIDYNQDGDFGDPGEFVYASPTSSTAPFSTTIAVPCDALVGTVRLRVRCIYNTTVAWGDTCNLQIYGETEDYNITILPPPFPGPKITLSDACLNYGTVFVGVTKNDTLTIANIGCDTLFVTSITNTLPQFVPDTNNLTLLPGTNAPVIVAFTPDAAIPYADVLTLLNNDNDTTVCLTGTGVLPPVIGLNPDSFEVTLSCGDSLIDTLIISNTGSSNLEYSVSIVPSAANTDLYNGFESGNLATWNVEAGPYIRNVTTLNPANGKYCFEQIGGGGGYDGISHDFPLSSPSYISFKVKTPVGAVNNGNCAVEVGGTDIVANGSICEVWTDNVPPQINLWTPSSGFITTPIIKGQWYRVELKNINFIAKTFDYYLNGVLLSAGVQFWNGALNNVSEIHLFSWANDTSYFDEIIIGDDFPGWLFSNPQFGTVVPAGSQDVQIFFEAAGLTIGQYIGRLLIQSNDPVNPQISVPCTLNVTGFPQIVLSDTCLVLDTIFQFSTITDTFFIANTGCDTLTIDSLIASNNDFTVDTVSPFVLPYDTGIAIVRFSPLLATTYNEILTIYSNAPDTAICLIGVSLPPPTIVINPTSFNVSVACGDTLIDTLNISNTGASGLIFNMTGCGGSSPLTSVLSQLNLNYSSITSLVPSLYLFTDGVLGNNINDGGNDMYDWGNYLNTNLGANLSYSDNLIINSAAMGAGGKYFTRKNPGLFVFAADVNAISYFEITGNNGADGNGNMDATILTTQLCGVTYKGFVKRVYNATDPSINHLIIVEDKPGIAHNYSTDTDNDQHRVLNLNSTTRIYYLLYASSGGGYVNDAITLNIMNEFLQNVADGGIATWAALSSTADTLLPAGSTDIQAVFNSAGKNAGVYNTYYVVSSNDPANPVDTIPVTMNVIGSPSIEFSDTCIIFDTIFQFGTTTDTLFIANTGCDTLDIDSVLTSIPEFTIDSFSVFIAPGDTGMIIGSFSPLSVGAYNEILTVYSDAPDTFACLAGYALPPPTLVYNPPSFNITVACGDSITDTLTVSNAGASDLIFSIEECDSNPALENILTRLNQNYASVTALVPSIYYFTEGVTGNNIVDGGGDDMYDGGNYLNTDLGGSLAYSDNAIISSAAMGAGGRYFTRKNPGLFVFAADVNAISYFEITGNNGADGGGNIDAAVLTTQMCGKTFKGFVKRVYNAFDPSINHLIIVEDKPGINHNYSIDTDNDQHRVFNLNSSTRIYYLLYASSVGGYVNNVQTQNIMNEFLRINLSDVSWITPAITGDTLSPAGFVDVPIEFNSTGLVVGTYTTSLFINSNDPVAQTDTVPVIFTVTGAAEIVFSDTCLFFDTIFQFAATTDTLLVVNTGCDTLVIDSLSVSNSVFIVDTVSPFVAPGDTGIIIVSFAPVTVNSFNESLFLFSNLPDTVVCLKAVSIPPPVIVVNPDSFNITLTCCDSLIDTMKIYNSGGSPLIFDISNIGGLPNPIRDFLIIDHGKSKLSFAGYTIQTTTEAGFFGMTESQLIENKVIYFEPDWGNYNNLTGNMTNLSNYVNQGGTVVINIAGNIGNGTNIDPYGTDYSRAATHDAETFNLPAHPYITGIPYGGSTLIPANFNFWGSTDHGTLSNYPPTTEVVLTNTDGTSWIHYTWGTGHVILTTLTYRWGGSPNNTCDNLVDYANYLANNTGVSWLSVSPVADTVVPSDSSLIELGINSCNLVIGTYTTNIVVNSNDPQNPADTIPVILNVVGAPELALSDSCIFFDTIMELTTADDTLLVINTGCDTLTGYVLSSSPYFSLDSLGNDSVGGDILPGDTAFVVVIFAPDSAGPFNGTLSLVSNAGDTVICLNGFAYPKPILCYNPDSFFVYFPVCVDSITQPFLICNSGGSDLNWNITTQVVYSDDFDPGIYAPLWSAIDGAANLNCGSVSGNALFMDNMPTRQAATVDFNTLGGGTINFDLKLGNNIPGSCEMLDFLNEVYLQYSNNGGGIWTTVLTFNAGTYPVFTLVSQAIPPAARTAATRFRVYQSNPDCFGCDNWAIDNFLITLSNPNIIPSPVADTTIAGDTTLVNILFTGNGLSPGVYNFQFFVNTNDPLNQQVTIPVVFNIDSVAPPPPAANDTSVCEGNPNPPLLATGDSIKWYSDGALTILVGTGNSYVPADVLPGVYDYFATSTDSFGCQSLADTVYFTISTASTAPVNVTISPDSICPGISTTLTRVGGALGIGAQWMWYADSCGGLPIDTGTSIVVTPPVTTVYFVRAESSCDTTACAFDTVNVSGSPSTVAASVSASANNICPAQLVTLKPVGGSLGTGASWNWFNAGCGAGFITSADSITVNPAVTTTYYVRAEGTCNTTVCVSVTINVTGTNSSAPTGVTASVNPTCPLQSTTLTRTGGTLGTGASFIWYADSCGGVSIGTGNSIVVSPADTTTYYVRAEGTCNTTTCANMTINVSNTLSAAAVSATATPATICNGDTSTLNVVGGSLGTGASWQWYTVSCGGIPSGTGISIQVNPNDTTAYFVRAEGTCNTTACVNVSLIVNPVPSSPISNDTSACEGGGIPDLTASGTYPKWYSDPGLTVFEYAGSPFATGETVGGIYTYYVTDSTNGCISPATTVVLTINSASTVPTGATTSADSTCPGTSVTLTRTGGVLGVGAQWVWYSGSCGGTPEGTDTSITDAPVATTTYYVRAEGACNTTACANITVSVTKTPSTAATGINASINNICPSQSVTLKPVAGSLGTGASWKWFDAGCSSGPIGSGDSLIVTPAVTTTYYVKAEGTCNTTTCASVTINVTNTLSTAPTGATASVNPTCPSQSTTLTRTGGSLGTGASYVWYEGSCGGVLLGAGNSIAVSPAVTTTYYVRAEGTCNTTACASITINVTNTLSTAAASATVTPATICNSDTSTLNIVGGSLGTAATWQWYTVSCGGTTAGSGASINANPNDTTTYYVRAEGTCNTTVCVNVTLNINPIPSAPFASDTSGCEGGSIPDLTATGTNPKWYSDPALTVFEYAGSPFATGETAAGFYTYYVTDSANGCTGPSTAVTLTINSGSTAPTGATTGADSTCPGTSTTLTRIGGALGVGAQWVWYESACGGTSIGTDTSVSVNPLVTTTYFVRAEGACDTTVCASVNVNVTKLQSVGASAINASSTTTCPAEPVVLKPTGGSLGTGASWKWFDAGCSSGPIGSGDSIIVNPAVTTTYYVKAEGTCNTTACASITINVTNTLSTAPASATATVNPTCPSQSTTLTRTGGSLGTGASFVWYADSCGGVSIGTGNSIVVSPADTTTYYVRAEGTCNTTICASITINVSNTLSATAASATASPSTICNGDTSILSVSGGSLGTGATWQWYSVSCGGTAEGTGASSSVNPNDTTTYFVRAEGSCNTTACVNITLNVNPIPSAPAVSDTSGCEGGVIPDLTATGTNPKWYSDAALTVFEYAGSPYATGETAAGFYTYYVTDSGNGCTGPSTAVTLTINSGSNAPTGATTSADSTCPGASATLTRTGGVLGIGAQWVWYESACGGTAIGTDTSVSVSPLVTTTYFVRAEGACDTTVCASVNVNVTKLQSVGASAINASSTTTCPAEPVVLKPTGGLLGTGASWKWFDAGCSSGPIGSGDSLIVTPAVTTTYFVKAEGTCNTTTCASVTINVTNTLSTAPTGATASVNPTCPSQSTTLTRTGGSLGTGASFVWYADSCGGVSIGTGDSMVVSPADTTTYYVRAEGTCNTTACASVTINVSNTLSSDPASASATPSTICNGDTSILSVSGGSLGTGATWQWYSVSCGGTAAGTGTSISVNPNDTTTYFVRAEGLCNITACVDVTLDVNVLPATPSVLSESSCESDSIPSLITSGTNVLWYSDPALTVLEYGGNIFTTGDSATGIYTYYVTQTDTVTGCESPATTVTLTINSLPNAPSAFDTTVLYGNPVPDLVASGTNIQWYSDSVLTTVIATGTSYATGDTAVGIYVYYATQTDSVTGCESPAVEVALTILPGAPATTGTAICEGDSGILTATGSNIKWYSDSALTALVFSGTLFTPSDSAVGVYTYFATQTVNGFESSPSSATLTINPVPAPPVASSDTIICSGTPTPDLYAAGSIVQWYSDAALTVLVNTGDTFVTGITAGGVYTFYVTQSALNCESSPDSVTLTINETNAPSTLDTSICTGDPVPLLTATGINLKWYSDSGLTLIVGTGNSYNTGQTAAGVYTYYVTDSMNGCISAPATSTLIISTPNTPPSGAIADADSVCEGATVNLNVTGGLLGVGSEWVWYADSCGGTPVGTGDTVSVNPVVTTVYFVRGEGGCDSTICQSVTVNVTKTLSVAALSATTSVDSICPGISSILIKAGGTLGTSATWLWYADSCSGLPIGNGDSINVSPLVTTTYFIRAEGMCNTTACTPVNVNVTKTTSVSAAAIVSSGDSLCPNTTVTLNVSGGSLGTGASWQWYADSCSGAAFASGDSATVSPPMTTTYFVRAEGTCNTTACAALNINVTQTLSTAAAIAYALPDSTCPGVPSILSVTGGTLGTGALWNWYTDSCTGALAGSGDSVTVAPLATTTYYVKAEGVCNTTACVSVTVNVSAAPSTDPTGTSAVPATICSGGSSLISVSGGSLGTGASWVWYADSCSGTPAGTGSSIGVTPGDTSGYYVRAEGNCNTTACINITVNVNALPPPPVTGTVAVCENDTIPDLSATGMNPQWYNDSALTNLVAAGNTFATGQTLPGTYNYFVTDSINGCSGPASVASLTINPVPTPPVAPADTLVCYGSTTPDLVATGGTNIQWYSDAALAVLVNTGDTFITGLTNPGTYTFFVTQSSLGCESAADSVTVSIYETVPPTTTDTTACFGDTAPDLFASGSNIQWYSDSSLTTLVGSGNSYTTGQTAPGVYVYYATQTQNNCESQAVTATLTIVALPAAPVASDVFVCSGVPVPPLTASGSNIRWYSDSLLTILENSGDTFITGQTAVDIYTYYATQLVNGCESPAETVTLSIISSPAVPQAADKSVCEGFAVPPLVAAGNIIQWYSDSSLTNLVYTGDTFVTGQTLPGVYTYYVTDSLPGCVSNADNAVLTIIQMPSRPAGTDATVCYGDTVPDLYASGNNPQWYKDPALIIFLAAGNSYSTGIATVGAYKFYVTDKVTGCPQSSSDTVLLTINPVPLVTLNTYNTSIGIGDTAVLIAYNASSYTWTPTNTIAPDTGAKVLAFPLSNTVYTVTGTNEYGCSNTASVTVTVKGAGIAPVVTDDFGLMIYPNPTQNKVTVEFNLPSSDMNHPAVTVFNMLGEVIMQMDPSSFSNLLNFGKVNYRFEIDFNDQSDGVYYMQIISDEVNVVRKIVVVR